MTTTTPPATMTAARANRLAVAIETISEDVHCPIEISSRTNAEDIVTQFGVCCLLPTATIPPGVAEAETAHEIAKILDQWATRLTAVASVIRIRYPK